MKNVGIISSKQIKKQKNIIQKAEKIKILKEKNDNNINEIKQKIIDSDIDYSKYGWVMKAAILIGITPAKVNKWMKRNMIEFYEKNCFKRKSLSVL